LRLQLFHISDHPESRSAMPLEQSHIDALRNAAIAPRGLFIGGKWVSAEAGTIIESLSPLNGRKIADISEAGGGDVDRAVRAARASFEKGVWSKASPAERKKVLLKIAELIDKHALELAVLGVRDNGTEISMALKAEPGSAAATFRYYAEAIDKVSGEIAPTAESVLGLVHREPIGVIGAIVPWNFPLMIGAWKLAPALAAGNSVVLKPAELASLSWLRLAELCAEAGLPDGVFNVVTGRGSVTGEALALHMDVDVLAFTGSGVTGRRLLQYAAQSNLKRVYLELGGKSPNIVFADAPNLDQAAKVSAAGIFRNAGQVCVAGSRLLVEKSIHKEFAAKVAGLAAKMKVGDPLDLKIESGAVTSLDQLKKNLEHVTTAVKQGATLTTGGRRVHEDTGGYYMSPAVLDDVRPDMKIAQEEVFGPVLAILPFEDETDALRIANGTQYGLASAVWTSNLSRAHRMVKSINAGVVHVNTYGGADGTVPLGGHKQSGNGYDKSLHALDKYQNLKTAWIQL
jgi:4-(gamma-glutamylamino)butanal dehydrogenase